MKRSGIVAGGNWIVDHVKLIDAWPPQDSLATILSESSGNGGAPYNVLKDLARLGAPFPLAGIGLVGEDENGRRILADCRACGIDASQLRATPQAPTSYTEVMAVKATGRRTFFHRRGANDLLGPGDFDFARSQAKLFHLGYLLLLEGLDSAGPDGRPGAAEVLRRARAAGLATSLDCVSENSDRFRKVAETVLPEVDCFFANDFEAERLTGRRLRSGEKLVPAEIRAGARQLIESGVRAWVCLHYPEGACAASARGEIAWQPSVAIPESETSCAVGAGDAFAAGVLWGRHEDWPMEKCLRLGVCAAAASLRHANASEGVGTVAECLGLGEKFGFRENS